MSIIEIARKYQIKISANNGFFDDRYVVSCIVDAINEAIAERAERFSVSACVHGFAEGKCIHETCINHPSAS
jgi:hypothetical protein